MIGSRTRKLAAQQDIGIKRGLDVPLAGKPRQQVREGVQIRTVALAGYDFPGVRPEFRVEQGERVRAGQTLFVDRRRPRIAFTAPVAGTLLAIHRGRRRSLDSVVIRLEGEEAEDFSLPAEPSPEALRELLLRSGLWPSLLTRPFGRIPDPDAAAEAIFVTAVDTNPLAPDPAVAIGLFQPAFRRGMEALPFLTSGPVFLCQGAGTPLGEGLPERVRTVRFSGPHPAGLPGTHIHHLAPVGNGHSVWHISYQDVIAIGHLLLTGRLPTARIVALAGSGVRDPALLALPPGASLDEALEGELTDGPVRTISGPVLSGREAGYLGRYHNQVTVIASEEGRPAEGPFSRLAALFRGVPDAPIVPRERLEAVMPLDILPVPLMRALAVGDIETAIDLGCLELVEEDLALISHVCASGTDYGALLRETLDRIAEEG